MQGTILKQVDTEDIYSEAMPEGKLRPMPFAFYSQFDQNKLMNFMHKNALYILPTWELMDWLRSNIIGQAIEIGAGNGSIGRALNIPITDSYQQDTPEVRLYYLLVGQQVITYPSDVEKLEALEAVKKYSPDTIVGSYITHRYDPNTMSGNATGPDMELILPLVKRYIMIGNLETHGLNPLFKKRNAQYRFPWLICRAINQADNRIFVWDNKTI